MTIMMKNRIDPVLIGFFIRAVIFGNFTETIKPSITGIPNKINTV